VVGDMTLTADQVKAILAEKAARDSRAATMPKDAASYDLSLPQDFQLPVGMSEWKWNTEDPVSAALLGQAKEFAHAHGLDQPAFSKMLGLYASHQIADEQRFSEAKRAELSKLGPNAPTRVDAVVTWLQSQVGSKLADTVRRSLFTADQIVAFEKIMRNFVSQGIGGNVGGGRDPGGAGPERISDEAYAKLSYSEKQAYAARFDQRQFGG
jgi:hypothetical protein